MHTKENNEKTEDNENDLLLEQPSGDHDPQAFIAETENSEEIDSSTVALKKEILKLCIKHNLPKVVHKKILRLLHHPKASFV